MKDLKNMIDRISEEMLVRIVSYLRWERLPDLKGGSIKQYVSPDREYVSLIPMIKDYSDYYQVVYETLNSIAVYEKISIEGLFNKILNPSCDILKWRISDDYTNSGKISFLTMADTIDDIKDMLATACLDELNPAKYHGKVYTSDVNEKISKYAFGQTEVGSYMLNILCPLGNYQYGLFDDIPQEIPYFRKVNIRLMSSINEIQECIRANNESQFDEAVDAGRYSVNFLDSLTKIYDSSRDSELSIIADWNTDVPLSKETIISHVKMEATCVDRVVYVAEKYRPKKEQNIPKTFYGKITNVGSDPDVGEREYVNIQIVSIGNDNKKINVNVKLNYMQYFRVVQEAFELGSDVRVTGIYSYSNKTKLDNASIEILT